MRALVRLETPVTTKNSTINCRPAMSSQGAIMGAAHYAARERLSERGEAFADGELGQVGDRMQVELADDVAAVHVDGRDRDAELGCNFRRVPSLGEQAEHLALAAPERADGPARTHGLRRRRVTQLGRQIRLALRDGADG